MNFLYPLTGVVALVGGLALGEVTKSKYKQPVDASVRRVIPERVLDGDTFLCRVYALKLGQQEIVMEHVKVRLKDVRCYEMSDETDEGKKIALMEQKKLNELLMANDSQPITVKFYAKQTHDRYEGIVYSKLLNINEEMLKLPQGGN